MANRFTIAELSVLTGESWAALYKRLQRDLGAKKTYSLEELEKTHVHVKIPAKLFIDNYRVLEPLLRK